MDSLLRGSGSWSAEDNLIMKPIENLIEYRSDDKHAYNFKDRTGHKYGRVTVQRLAGYIYNKHHKRIIIWDVICECGKKFYVRGNDLVTGQIKSCGCQKREATILFNKTTKTKVMYNTFSAVWQSYRRGAIERGLDFNLSKKQFYDLTQKDCYYCGQRPSQIRKPRYKGKYSSYIYNGIDRVNSKSGYDMHNCVPCCGVCNKMKSNHSFAYFIEKIKEILLKHG